VDAKLREAVEAWLRALSGTCGDFGEPHATTFRRSALPWLLDLAALALEAGDGADAGAWLRHARGLARGARDEARVAAFAALPPWFAEARRLRWLAMNEADDETLEEAEEAFAERWGHERAALSEGLGAGS